MKPKTQTLNVSGSHFKGKTEYQSEYINEKALVERNESKRTLEELQTIMLRD